MSSPSPWWDKQVHADRRPYLLARGRIGRAIRDWFAAHDFLEVETAILQTSPGNETHLHAFATELEVPGERPSPLYLRTSPEFSCKKLLAAGERRIFDFARAFRNRERGALHHPEFTMLEWYRADEGVDALMQDCAAMLTEAARATGATQFAFRDRAADPSAEPERLSVADAFARYADVDVLASISDSGPDRDRIAAGAAAAQVRTARDDTWLDIFSRILVERVEPHLGNGRATFLYDYPAVQSALARPKASDPRVAERFELYVCGVELANGFGELTDAAEQRRRLAAEMAEKERIYGQRYPIDEDFLKALALMPPASGVALGFDRLVMLATKAERIEQVLWTPVAGPGP
jgi:lysyl-tRNA synthetase class 2